MKKFQKHVIYTIIKINYDNGKNIVMASTAPHLTEMKLKEAIENHTCKPNFVHELYAVDNNIKTFTIDILEDDISSSKYRQKVRLYSKKFNSEKPIMTYDVNWCMNRCIDSFASKQIFLDTEKIETLKKIINKFEGQEELLKILGDHVYKCETYEEFKGQLDGTGRP